MKLLSFIFYFCFLVSAYAQQERERAPDLEAIVTTNIVVDAGEPVTIPGPVVAAQFAASVSIPGGNTNGVVSDWSFSDAPGLVTFSNINGLTNTGSFSAAGRYTITYRARKGIYENTSSFFVFVVDQGITNFLPTIELTGPPNGAEFTQPIDLQITADATDKDGTIDQVVFYNGPTILGTSTVAPYSLTLTNAGATNYVLAASVTDNRGATNLSRARSVLVNPLPEPPPANVPPLIVIDTPAGGSEFVDQVTLSIGATASDLDGTITSVTFADNGQIIGTDLEAPYAVIFTPAIGSHELTATAVDNMAAMTIVTNTITVVSPPAPNPAPVVSVTAPADGSTFTAPADVTVSASASDVNGSVVSVQFFSNGGSIGSDSTAPYSITFPGVGVGTYVISATATDNQGAIGTSTNITFTVNPAPGIPPVVTLTGPADGSVFVSGATVNLTATATDANGIKNVLWYSQTPDSPPDPDFTNQVIRTFIASDTNSPYSKNWTPVANSYGLIAVAIDNTGLASTTAVSTITVRLPIPPSVTLTSPTNGQVFQQGATIPLAAGITDPDSLAASVSFWQYQPDNLISTDATSPYSGSWAGVPAGNYSIVAKVNFNGGVASSAAVSIQIQAAPPVTVYVDAGPAKTAILSVYEPYFQAERTANQGQFNNYAGSTGSSSGVNKYDFQYVWLAYRDMYLATLKTNYIDQALVWCEAAVAAANITDSHGNKNWGGPWASGLAAQNISYELYDIQGGAGISSVMRTVLVDPDLRAVFGARATLVYNFVRDQIINKILVVRNGLPWYRQFLHDPSTSTTDKPALVLGMLLDLKLSSTALGNTDNTTKGYPAMVTEFANGIKDYNGITPCFTPWLGGLTWQKGHNWQGYTAFDTSHCERIPEVVIDCYRAGVSFDFTFIQGLANLLTKGLWDQSLASPQIKNFIDGSNGAFLNRGPYADGKIYAGWSMLAEFDPQALVVSRAMLSAIKNGVVNPSIAYNNTFLGRSALSAHIARAVSARTSPPYAKLDGVVTGSPVTSTTWTRTAGPGTATIVKPNSPVTTVLFSTNAVGSHTFRLTVVSGGSNITDSVTVNVQAAPTFDGSIPTPPQANIFNKRYIFWRGDLTSNTQRDRLITNVMNPGAAAGWNGVMMEETGVIKNLNPTAAGLANLAQIKNLAASLDMALIPSSMSMGEPPKTSSIELREAFPVVSTKFVRSGSTALPVGDPAPTLVNGGMETFTASNTPDGWSVDLPGTITFQDTTVKHGGASSVRMQNPVSNPSAQHARVVQTITTVPYRAYRVSMWVKTEAFTSPGSIKFNAIAANGRTLYANRDLPLGSTSPTSTQDWTQYTIAFNSLESTSINLYLVATSSATGKVWFDDVTLTEIGLANIVRRSSTPVVVKSYDGTITYTEGSHYTVQTEQLGIPGGSTIPAGASLKVSWYQLANSAEQFAIPGTSCQPQFFTTLTTNTSLIQSRMGPLKGFHMRPDEVRVANWDPSCGVITAGNYMAQTITGMENIIKALSPAVERYVWNDMFDPFHNAIPIYYMANGSMAGSWNGLSSDTLILNWYNAGTTDNMRFWSGSHPSYPKPHHNQMLAFYYEATSNVSTWLSLLDQAEGQGVTGVIGCMYTTFANGNDGGTGRYDDLEAVATICRNAGRWGAGSAF